MKIKTIWNAIIFLTILYLGWKLYSLLLYVLMEKLTFLAQIPLVGNVLLSLVFIIPFYFGIRAFELSKFDKEYWWFVCMLLPTAIITVQFIDFTYEGYDFVIAFYLSFIIIVLICNYISERIDFSEKD